MSKIKDTFFGGAEKRAGRKQQEAFQEGIGEQRRQFDITESRLQEAEQFRRGQIQPFQEAGVAALDQQQVLLGLSGEEAQQQAFAGLSESPGQQFLRKRQEKAILRNASATGGLGGGNVLNALQENAFNLAQTDIENQFGRLGQLSGRGQQAGAELGAGAVRSAGDLGQFGQTNVANISNLRTGGSAARASGILGQAAQLRAFEEQQSGRAENAVEFFGGFMGA